MKKTILYILVLIYVFAVSEKLFSQQQDVIPKIKVLALNKKTQVYLRWAPNTPASWSKLNKIGYEIERITVKKDGKLMPPSFGKKILDTIKPQPLEDWRTIAKTNNYAAMVAQLLYGEKSSTSALNPIAAMFSVKKDLDNRFSFVLLASDMNFEAACMAGLGYIDTTVEPNTEYLYRVKSVDSKGKIETGLKLLNTEQEEALPPPIDLFALSDDKKITITWDKEVYKAIYTAYVIEKSDDSLNFTKVKGGLPFINFTQGEESNNQMFYTDSIAKNYTPYYYRIIGISAFGEKSPPSKVLMAQGVTKLTTNPKIISSRVVPSGDVLLNWTFDKEAQQQIKNFSIDWAPKADGPYTTIKKDIPNDNRSAMVQKVEASNYYKINALGVSHQKTASLMHFVQPIDSIPPVAPIGLHGTIDSLGIVNLSWQGNAENDIRGYIIRKANLKEEKTIPISADLVTSTAFVDTVQIKSLNSSVFYQVVALDKRYNISELSQKLELKKPDVVPPVPPIFEDYKVTKEGIALHWINSSSNDVVSHYLYRKVLSNEENDWQVIFKTDTVTRHVDKNVKPGVQYKYAIFANDDSQLRSEPSTSLTVTATKTQRNSVIKGFNAIADREDRNIIISWRKMPDDVVEILIYRAKNAEPPMLWRQIPGHINELVDTRINPDNTYTYTLKTIFDTETISQTKSVEVTY